MLSLHKVSHANHTTCASQTHCLKFQTKDLTAGVFLLYTTLPRTHAGLVCPHLVEKHMHNTNVELEARRQQSACVAAQCLGATQLQHVGNTLLSGACHGGQIQVGNPTQKDQKT